MTALNLNSSLEALRNQLNGTLILRDEDGYEAARQVHNLAIDRHPGCIVQAVNTRDVAAAVQFAVEHQLAVSVKSGGHSPAGHSVIDGALLIDLSKMRAVSIDAVTKRARVQSGATSGDLAGPAHAYGLALTTGDTATVGLGGLVTGGGIGWMSRKYGLTIDHLLSAEIVLADGRVVRASKNENQELFWAIRGGGGNFGIVTEFEFQLEPIGSVLGGMLVLPATRETLRGFADYAPYASNGLTTIASVMHAPPAPFIPADKIGSLVLVVFVAWTGDVVEGERAIAPLRALAEPIADLVGEVPYPAMFSFTAAADAPAGSSVRSMYAGSLPGGAIDAILDHMSRATAPATQVQLRALGGAISDVAPGDTAFSHRDQPLMVTVLAIWENGSEDPAPHQAWTEALWKEIRALRTGVYANFLGNEPGRLHEAYDTYTLRRLAEVKAQYDPTNLFRHNQNIKPALTNAAAA